GKGGKGYLFKTAAGVELESAIKAVLQGDRYVQPELLKKAFLSHINDWMGVHDPLAELTPRQREVLRLIAEGHSTRDIASTLNISVKTVETHRGQLMKRLDIHHMAGLVRYAIRIG